MRGGLAGIVLAAGRSARMGPERNKLVEPVAGRPLVAWPVDALLEAGIAPVFVVVGFESDRIRTALRGRPCRFVEHAEWPEGMGSSLARAMRELLAESPLPEAVLVCVGDLPGLRAADVARVVDAARREVGEGGAFDPDRIVVPVFDGRRGHPVCFGARHFAALAQSTGDEGARALLEQNADRVLRLEIANEAILRDVDTPTDLESARKQSDPD
jgi:CTP:molybdopterin cytidylyltransferase MocA